MSELTNKSNDICSNYQTINLKNDRNILYIMVIGFHHKKGCQLEFVYPTDKYIRKKTLALDSSPDSVDLYEMPKKWKHLPSLALPDGSHNYEQDYIYFHLEDVDDQNDLIQNESNQDQVVRTTNSSSLKPNKTLFGVSCYRQINASELINKDSDVTRNTLQKSVCILSRLPFYSSLRLKLHSITTAYFEQKDFHKTQLLTNAFHSLLQSYNHDLINHHQNILNNHKSLNSSNQSNSSSRQLTNDLFNEKSKFFIGLSLSDLVVRYQHKILVLFKLLLLQKKCLFQLKPVSNLSNTIMSLVSLFPDIFFPHDQSQTGLSECSGYFDSIDLVNSELERKNRLQQQAQVQPPANEHVTQSISFHDRASLEKMNKKMHKKKLKSFASTKKHMMNTSNSSPSIAASFSSPSIKTEDLLSNTNTNNGSQLQNQVTNNEESNKVTSSFLNALSSNTQRLFSFNNPNINNNNNSNSKQLATSLESDSDLYKLTNDDKHDFLNINQKQSKLDFKQNIYTSNRSSSSSLNHDPDNDNEHNHHQQQQQQQQIGDLIKSKVTNVLKLVDWSANATTTNNSSNTSSTTSTSQSSAKRSSVHLIKRSESIANKISNEVDSDTNDSKSKQQQQQQNEIQLTDLLQLDFGMPLDVFNEFNILHPYLSLYYLDYFTMINKMSTKLYCTTALMMSMMKDNREENKNDSKEEDNVQSAKQTENSSSNEPFTPYNPLKKKPEPKTIGYTIGATNVLFKQRLYDDLDAFIEETDIDLRNNENLKKQLQLTTADLRFADYIIKNVNASRNLSEKHQNTPTLLSFKKTSSFNNFDKGSNVNSNYQDMTETSGLSSSWEGSDDWIRLNFKWYLYTLLSSILKEDICNKIKNELESILYNMNSELNTSSSSSTASLENDVVDIDEYIEKVNNNHNNNFNTGDIGDLDHSNGKKRSFNKHKQKENRKSSSSSSTTSTISSAQYFYIMQNSNAFLNYREDFNSNFINEFKKTDCFNVWHEKNKQKLEKVLFKFDSDQFQQIIAQNLKQQTNSLTSSVSTDSINLNHRFQVLYSQLQEIEQVKLNHPFNGQISVNDIRLRFNFLFTTTESGRKLNKALAEGSKIVNNTGKAVGDALSSAKSTFSSFLSNWTSNSNQSTNSKTSTSKNFTKI